MTTLEVVWAASLLVTLATLPVGAFRMVIYRSGETDHTRTHLMVARLALGMGAVALVVLLVTSVLLVT